MVTNKCVCVSIEYNGPISYDFFHEFDTPHTHATRPRERKNAKERKRAHSQIHRHVHVHASIYRHSTIRYNYTSYIHSHKGASTRLRSTHRSIYIHTLHTYVHMYSIHISNGMKWNETSHSIITQSDHFSLYICISFAHIQTKQISNDPNAMHSSVCVCVREKDFFVYIEHKMLQFSIWIIIKTIQFYELSI